MNSFSFPGRDMTCRSYLHSAEGTRRSGIRSIGSALEAMSWALRHRATEMHLSKASEHSSPLSGFLKLSQPI